VRSEGSAPRDAGARMLIAADATVGTIGGGHLELKAIAAARSILARPNVEQPREERFALGPALGQCCGGSVTLRYALLCETRPAAWDAPAPRFTLQLHGAGHVGRAIVALLDGIACRVQWVDERDDAFPPTPSAAHVERVCVDAVEAEVACAPPGAFYLVLTHRHDVDFKVTEAILRRADFGFLGLIGSKTKRNRFRHRYEAMGVAPAVLDRMTCPIGLPGIDGKEPEVIAVAVVAQLLQLSGAAAAAASPHPALTAV
jgi:xanthine dehydrogenase accessory factor